MWVGVCVAADTLWKATSATTLPSVRPVPTISTAIAKHTARRVVSVRFRVVVVMADLLACGQIHWMLLEMQ